MRTISFRELCALMMLAVAGTMTPQLGQVALAQFQIPGLADPSGPQTDPYTISAQFTAPGGGQPARLFITAQFEPTWYTYSVTQPPGGPVRTKIALDEGQAAKLAGDFASVPPFKQYKEAAFKHVDHVETHSGTFTWYAPLEVPAGTDFNSLQLRGKIFMQVCQKDGVCLPPKNVPFVAALGPGVEIPKSATAGQQAATPKQPSSGLGAPAAALTATSEIAPPNTHAKVRFVVDSTRAQPGGSVQLDVTIEPDAGYHVYPLPLEGTSKFGKPTILALTQDSGFTGWAASADRRPVSKASDAEPGGQVAYYDRPVTLQIKLGVPNTAKPGEHAIQGVLGLQTCNDNGCDRPDGVDFAIALPIGEQKPPTIELKPGSYLAAAKAEAGEPADKQQAQSLVVQSRVGAFDPALVRVHDVSDAANMPTWMAMLFGLAGGFILNFMPCVLPVIGLKILSFVEQSGHSRSRIFLLNVAYTLGLLSVFMVLAVLAVFFGFGWGQLSGYAGFNIALAAIIFIMSLSFLGVWEIPLPGFVGTGKANDLAAKEGYSGAFFKGVITTILATPCSGPFLGSALFWAAAQPPPLVFALFACIGLGMASPYLVIGAVPALIRLLPRPGMWMDTFKQIMGFVLLATVIYLLTILKPAFVVPTVALLFGLWGACWWVGRTPLTAGIGAKLMAWGQAAIFSAIVAVALFPGFDKLSHGRIPVGSLESVMNSRFESDVDVALAERKLEESKLDAEQIAARRKVSEELPWEPFSFERLIALTAEGKTVFVDFTADWCPTCKTLEKLVLNTEPTRRAVEQNHIVTLVADWTNLPDDVTEMLKILGSKQIPVWAIFPAGRPNDPIVMRGYVDHDTLLKAFAEAGPSKTIDANRGTVSAK